MFVEALTTPDLAQACRIFMGLAYPDGPESIPERRRPYHDPDSDAPIETYLPPAPLSTGIVQDLSMLKGGIPGYEFRLGSTHYPHLKLRIQRVEFHHRDVWVYSVDTHDHFHQAAKDVNPEDAEAWRRLVEQNRALKHRIEEALALAGFLTPKSLLRLDLTSPANPS